MYLANNLVDILPLSPTSEYSSDGSSSIYSPSLLMAHHNHTSHNTPSPPVDAVRSVYHADHKSVLTWSNNQYYSGVQQDSSDPHYPRIPSSYDDIYPGRTNSTNGVPVSTQYRLAPANSYGNFTFSPPPIPAPTNSTSHGSLPSIALSSNLVSNARNPQSSYDSATSTYDMFPHQTSALASSHHQSLLNARASNNGSADYSSTTTPPSTVILPGGLRHDESSFDPEPAAQTIQPSTQSYALTYALPSVEDMLNGPGPTRTSRNRDRPAPYYATRRASLSNSRLDGPPSSSRITGPPDSHVSPVAPLPLSSPSRRQRSKKPANAGTEHRSMEKNYVCTTCDARFARNHDLTRHHKVHDPIKQYRCSGCDRSFTRKDALKRHSTQKRCGDADWPVKPTAGPSKSRKRAATASESPTIPYHQPPSTVESPTAYTHPHHPHSRSNSQYVNAPLALSSSSAPHHYPTRTRHGYSYSVDGQ